MNHKNAANSDISRLAKRNIRVMLLQVDKLIKKIFVGVSESVE